MSVDTFAFDASEHLDDANTQRDYLRDAASTGDAAAVAHALGVIARARGLSQIAHEAGVERKVLYQAIDSSDIAALRHIAAALNGRLSVAA